ncbi:DinB family protein [Chloroflexota bacterium]
MSRTGLLDRLEREWKAFLESFEGLPDSVLMEPGAVGHWSVRNVLAHISTWEEEALKALLLILEGKRPPRYGGIDAFNAREQERKRVFSLDQVKQELVATHQHLMTFLASCPKDNYATESRFRRRLRLDTYHHYREHAAQITTWRAKRGL